FLQCSEAVKFANQAMSLEDCERWSEAVKQFLQAARRILIGSSWFRVGEFYRLTLREPWKK
ncbi:MAG: hypothetical protein ACREMY_20070, partial [bacterium]